jgi:hypothetical protein
MKIDIEGADRLCLESLLDSEDRPKFVSIESSRTSFDDLVNEFCLLQRLGFKKYKIVAQHRIGEQRLPNPAREGRFVDHIFEEHSSGAFGRELPGEWLSLEQALKVYMRLFKKYRTVGDHGSISSVLRDAANSERRRLISSVALLARNIFRSKMLRGIRSRLRAGWYDTHALRED